MLGRFRWQLVMSVIATAVILCLVFLVSLWLFPDIDKIDIHNRFSEFDAAGYAFGLVAVAVSCAGVYISIVFEKAADTLCKMVEVHLTPDPFQDKKTAEEICKPADYDGKIQRSTQVKVIYAIIQLTRWATLKPEQKEALVGRDGLDAEEMELASLFRPMQNQTDRKIVLQLAIIISVLYFSMPFFYFYAPTRVITTILVSTYFLCVAEIFLCSVFFARRSNYLDRFEKRLGTYRDDLKNFLVAVGNYRAQNPKT